MAKVQKNYPKNFKQKLVKLYLVDKIPYSQLSLEYHVPKSTIASWVKQFASLSASKYTISPIIHPEAESLNAFPLKLCNLGELAKIFKPLRNENQVQTIEWIYNLILITNESSSIQSTQSIYNCVSDKEASYIFTNKISVRDEIRFLALNISNNEAKLNKLTNLVSFELYKFTTPGERINLVKEIQSIIVLDSGSDYLHLSDFLSINYLDNVDLAHKFISLFILYCLLEENNLSITSPKKKIVLKEKPKSYLKYDPHNLVGVYSHSTALQLSVCETHKKTDFFDFEHCIEYIVNNNLLIQSININNGLVTISTHTTHYVLKRLDTDEEFIQAQQFILSHIDEFHKKVSWKTSLSDMVYKGLHTGKWIGYAYYNESGHMIAYLDYKIRMDGSIEIGTQLTKPTYRGNGLATSLVYLFKIRFFGYRLFGGTSEENIGMRSVFEKTGFKENLFYDAETGTATNLIQERVNSDFPNDPTKNTNSVYYYCNSLLTLMYNSF